jgi:hypothetical protein
MEEEGMCGDAVLPDVQMQDPSALGLDHPVGRGGGDPWEAAERAFWELVFSKHDRLTSLSSEVAKCGATRGRELARLHVRGLFSDLVLCGLARGVVGFHRTGRLEVFLEDMEVFLETHRCPNASGAQQFISHRRPDFLRCLEGPGRRNVRGAPGVRPLQAGLNPHPHRRTTAGEGQDAEAEYLLVAPDGAPRPLSLPASLCSACCGGGSVAVPGLTWRSDLQALSAGLARVVGKLNLQNLVLRVRLQDAGGDPTEVRGGLLMGLGASASVD